ncbi:hypothetical protein Q9966_014791 [Columba livia]|nr:hypothetical protein Q9966_014791 [Columba livia]
MLPQPMQDLLALLHEQGPSTEGIFRLAASERASREIREALDSGTEVHLASQPVHVLAVILKDFLRKIPSKLLVAELYQQWMAALQKSSREERLVGLKECLQPLQKAKASTAPLGRADGGARSRRRRWLPWRFVRPGTSAAAEAPGPSGSARTGLLFGRPLADLCSQDGMLPQPMQDLLALLHEQGPSTEGIFRLAASERASREIREALDSGTEVHLASQPVHVLAVILKDFLRKIPSKLLVAELYQQWMAALQKSSREERLVGLKECLQPLQKAKASTAPLGRADGGARSRRRRWLPWRFVRPGTSAAAEAPGPSGSARTGLLFGRPLADLCSQDGMLPQPLQDLLALLHEQGPSTEGIFRLAASERASREIREALDSGTEVHLASQPVHVLAVILKDFLRKIPSKLLVAELYQQWMAALQKSSREERLVGLKECLQPLQKAKASTAPLGRADGGARSRRRRWLPWRFVRPGTSAAAEAPGPSGSARTGLLFGRPLADLCSQDGMLPQPLQDLLALLHEQGPSTEGIFRLAASERASREIREALDSGTEVHLASQPVHVLAVILKDFLRKIPSKLLVAELYQQWMAALQKSSREERLVGLKECLQPLQKAKASTAPLGRADGGARSRRRRWLPWRFVRPGTSAAAEAPGPSGSARTGLLFGRPLADLCSQDGMLPQPMQDLLALLHEQGPSTEGIFRLAASERASREIREALDSGTEVHLASQPVHVLAVILKDFLRKIPSKLLVAELYQQWMAALQKSSREERLVGLKECLQPLQKAKASTAPLGRADGGARSRRRRWLPWRFVRPGTSAAAEAPGPSGSARTGLLFGQPLVDLCSQDGMLPQPMQDLLALLHEQGPSTEGIFRLAASERASREIREALDSGTEVHLASQPVHVLAVILKDFLRKIPSKLLVAELYQQWMAALQKSSREERLVGLKECLQPLQKAKASTAPLGRADGGARSRRRRWLPWRFVRPGTSAAAEAPGPSGSARTGLLFGRPLADLCSQDGMLPQPMQDLLALLHEHGPSTEGIFRLAASERASREIREALDSGTEVHLASQPVHVLAVILKDFLRKIPSKLLVAELYQQWMAALQKSSREERLVGLKECLQPLQKAKASTAPLGRAVNDDMCVIKIILNERKKVKLKKKEKYVKDKGKKLFYKLIIGQNWLFFMVFPGDVILDPSDLFLLACWAVACPVLESNFVGTSEIHQGQITLNLLCTGDENSEYLATNFQFRFLEQLLKLATLTAFVPPGTLMVEHSVQANLF